MAGESPSLKQDDIEELLRQAQLASGLAGESAPSPAPLPPASEALADEFKGAEQAASAPASTTATAMFEPPGVSYVGRPSRGGVGDDVQFLLSQAEQAIASVDQPAEQDLGGLAPFELKDLAGAPASGEKATLELLKDVDLDLRIELGRTQMFLEDVLKLKRGSVVALDKLAGDPVDVFVNGRLVARGEVLVLNDNFCVRVTELLAGDDFD
jgi:flagellar motor switch protein FliN/FliY